MTLLQKIISVTFASIVLIVSVVAMLTLVGVLSPDLCSNIMENVAAGEFWSKIFFALFAILAILAVKEIAFGEKVSKEGREGLILENESGKLIISKESLDNLVSGVGKEIDGVENISSRTFIDVEKNVVVEANVVVGRETALKNISAELQRRVKEALKQTADLDVKYVNIKIKNISSRRSKKNINNNGNNNNKNNSNDNNTSDKNPIESNKEGAENNG